MNGESTKREKGRKAYTPGNNEDLVERLLHSGVNVSLLLAALNGILYLLVSLTGGSDNSANMLRWGASYVPAIQGGEYWRLFSSMFLHFGLRHLIGNMIFLLFLGDYLERYVGVIGYLIIYLAGGFLGNLLSYISELYKIRAGAEPLLSAGASGAVYAMLGAMVILLLLHKGKLEDLSLRRLLCMLVISMYVGFTSSGIDAMAHLGGFLAGAVLMLLISGVRKL